MAVAPRKTQLSAAMGDKFEDRDRASIILYLWQIIR